MQYAHEDPDTVTILSSLQLAQDKSQRVDSSASKILRRSLAVHRYMGKGLYKCMNTGMHGILRTPVHVNPRESSVRFYFIIGSG